MRLKRRRDFLRVAAARNKWVAPGLILQTARTPPGIGQESQGEGFVRIGFTASRKVGGAVARNRARRRLRAAVVEVMTHHAAPDYDYVVIARGATLSRRYADLVTDLDKALRKLGVYRAGKEGE